MFRFFRKHQWILIVVLSLTIISFLVFMGVSPSRSGGGGRSSGDFGSIYGHEISADEFEQAKRAFYFSYWQQTGGEWPDKSQSLTPAVIDQQTYSYLLIIQKAKKLGITISDDAVVSAANDFFRSPSLMHLFNTSQPVPPMEFFNQVLAPEGLTVADFQRAIRTRLAITQLVDVMGLPGALLTPQEASTMYNRENQEVSAQAVFFAASNYLSQIKATPAAVGQFYTNNMAAYREPDRVQVNYVTFEASNYLAQSKAEWAKTNFEQTVDSFYAKYASAPQFADAKTPEAAKAKMREYLVQQRALMDAELQARDFVNQLYAMTPVKPGNLAALAQQKKIKLLTSAPFSAVDGPQDFAAPAALTKAAFQLNADSPYTGPFANTESVYVISLAEVLPSAIPSLDQIHSQVVRDFEEQQAIALAQQAGTNFSYAAAVQVATGKSFSQAAVAAGHTPVILPAFSLSSSEVTGLDNRAEITQIKQAAFTTPVGRSSHFYNTAEGGFVMYVQSMLPVDQTKKDADFAQYLAQARRARASEAFSLWVNSEFAHEIASKPFFQAEQQRLADSAAK